MAFFSRKRREPEDGRFSKKKKARQCPPLSKKEERSLKALGSCSDPLIKSRAQALLKRQRRYKKQQSVQKKLHLSIVLLQNSGRILSAARASLAVCQALRPRPDGQGNPSASKKK